MDDNRELRAMLFSVIHIPPLPAIVSRLDREDNTVLDDCAVESSHSIIGGMLEWTALANNQPANTNRMMMQSALMAQFRSDLSRLDPINCPQEDLYNFYCHHTRMWINTYTSLGNMMRFKPLDYVLINDKTHQNMRGYAKAQYHLFTDGKENLEVDDRVSYVELMRMCAHWTKNAYDAEVRTEKDGEVNINTQDQCAAETAEACKHEESEKVVILDESNCPKKDSNANLNIDSNAEDELNHLKNDSNTNPNIDLNTGFSSHSKHVSNDESNLLNGDTQIV